MLAVILLALVGAGSADPARAAATDLVVLEATGPALTPGQRIDGSKPLRLEAGERIKLIASNGRLIRLSGPYNDIPLAGSDGDSDRLSQSLAALVGGGGTTTAMLGAHRAVVGLDAAGNRLDGLPPADAAASRSVVGTADSALPSPWLVDVTRDGDRCLHGASQPVILWREARDVEQPVELSVSDGAWRGKTEWPRGYAKLATPDALPRLDGERYDVLVGPDAVALRLHVIPDSVEEPAILAAWMMEKGCRDQAAALLRTADAETP